MPSFCFAPDQDEEEKVGHALDAQGLQVWVSTWLWVPRVVLRDKKEKQKEKKGKSAKLQKSQNELIEFWGLLKNRVKIKSDDFLANVTPRPTYYMGFFKGQGFFAYCIGRRAFRVELYFRSDLDKTYFDNIYNYKEEIESKLKGVVWERRDGKTASR